MADIEEMAVRRYLQAAHDRRGGWEMAMRMMASRLLVLEDRLLRAGVDFPTDATVAASASATANASHRLHEQHRSSRSE